MHLQKKLGIGFIIFGFVIIISMYFIANSGAFMFSSLVGLMAIFFGAFQLMIANQHPAHSPKTKLKKARR
jgi:VIT1/CCC1 family predicted Fe2+/Mn2+ transporter